MTVQHTQVAVISPHDVVDAGLTGLLDRHRSRIEIVHEWMTAAEDEPDVVLYDVLGLTDDWAEFDRLINQTAALVFAIGRDQRPDLLKQALAKGAGGCFLISRAPRTHDLRACRDPSNRRARLLTTYRQVGRSDSLSVRVNRAVAKGVPTVLPAALPGRTPRPAAIPVAARP